MNVSAGGSPSSPWVRDRPRSCGLRGRYRACLRQEPRRSRPWSCRAFPRESRCRHRCIPCTRGALRYIVTRPLRSQPPEVNRPQFQCPTPWALLRSSMGSIALDPGKPQAGPMLVQPRLCRRRVDGTAQLAPGSFRIVRQKRHFFIEYAIEPDRRHAKRVPGPCAGDQVFHFFRRDAAQPRGRIHPRLQSQLGRPDLHAYRSMYRVLRLRSHDRILPVLSFFWHESADSHHAPCMHNQAATAVLSAIAAVGVG